MRAARTGADASAKPDCYKCRHRGELPGSVHSRCANYAASVSGRPHGIREGWFYWPFDFAPVWLVSCDGYSARIDGLPVDPLPADSAAAAESAGEKAA